MLIFPFQLRGQGSRPRCPTLTAVPSYLTCLHSFSSRFGSVMSDSLQPYGLQNSRLPYPDPTTGACANPYTSSWWRHPTISSSVVPFSSCPQSFPASESFPRSQFFPSGGQSIGARAWASALVLPKNIQDWFPLELTGLTSFQSRGLSRVFSNITVQKHQLFSSQLSLGSNAYFHTWLLEKL